MKLTPRASRAFRATAPGPEDGTVARRPHGHRGQAIAELAIAAPILLLLMLVAVDFGRLFFSYIAVQNAAREATNYAAYHAADADWDGAAYRAAVADAGQKEANVQGQGGAGTLTISDPECFAPSTSTVMACNIAAQFANSIGNQVTVSASQPFTFITPIIGDLFGGAVTLSATATAPIMNPLDVDIEPGPSASASPTPTPTATTPGATPTPTSSTSPTPTPVPTCEVPDFKNGFWHNTGGKPAPDVWAEAGFTGVLENRAGTNRIKNQELKKKDEVPCTTGMWVDD